MLIYQMITENNSNKLEIWWAKWISRKILKQNEKLNFYMKPTWNFLWTAGGTRKILPKLILSLWHSVSHYNQSHPNPSFSHSNLCKLSKHGNISLLTKNENTLTDWKVLYKTSPIFPFTRYFCKIPVPIMSTGTDSPSIFCKLWAQVLWLVTSYSKIFILNSCKKKKTRYFDH